MITFGIAFIGIAVICVAYFTYELGLDFYVLSGGLIISFALCTVFVYLLFVSGFFGSSTTSTKTVQARNVPAKVFVTKEGAVYSEDVNGNMNELQLSKDPVRNMHIKKPIVKFTTVEKTTMTNKFDVLWLLRVSKSVSYKTEIKEVILPFDLSNTEQALIEK